MRRYRRLEEFCEARESALKFQYQSEGHRLRNSAGREPQRRSGGGLIESPSPRRFRGRVRAMKLEIVRGAASATSWDIAHD